MWVIVGLGNPGKKYEGTRHNIGFHVIDYIAAANQIKVDKLKFKALIGEGNAYGQKVLFVKPQTFMNLSGESIREILKFYKISSEKLIIIYDDISLETGKLRLRPKGSAGGHNGIKSIIYQTQTEVFPRIKVGVGAPKHPEHDLADFVLGKFSPSEYPLMDEAIKRSEQAIQSIMKDGIEVAMNQFNGNGQKS